MNFILFACFIISAQAFDFVSLEGGAPLHKCRRLTADGNGVIFTASHNATNCHDPVSENVLIVKCDKRRSLEEEYVTSRSIHPFRDFVYERVIDPSKPTRICFSMKYFGLSLAKIRAKDSRDVIWPWNLVASLGTRIVAQLQLTHESGYAHTDLHFGNVVSIQRNVSDLLSLMESELAIIDFGDAVHLEAGRREATSRVRSDLMQVIVALRFLVDGDRKFYVEKRYGFKPTKAMNPGEICAGAPTAYCDILIYLYHLRENPDYGLILTLLAEIQFA